MKEKNMFATYEHTFLYYWRLCAGNPQVAYRVIFDRIAVKNQNVFNKENALVSCELVKPRTRDI